MRPDRSAPPLCLLAALAVAACDATGETRADFEPSTTPGGDTTVVDRTSQAFMQPAPNLDPTTLEAHLDGDLAFEAEFVTAPANVNPGLGPTYNNVGCVRCHVRDGRGMPAVGPGPLRSHLLVRVSQAEGEPAAPGGSVPVEGLGGQIQDQAIYGAAPEAIVTVTWKIATMDLAGGRAVELRAPLLAITLPDGRPLPSTVMTSLRQPPPVFGLGLLEALPEADLRALADPDDADGDGISGRPNEVWDPEVGATVLGRFGHKANTSNLRVQAAAAYSNDMGISSPLFPEPDASAEIDDETLQGAVVYTRTLAVPAPAQRAGAAAGAEQFRRLGCAGCHVETLVTGTHEISALSEQTIHPYTDLLLHDLGEGLADGRPDFLATGREWRTAPLWGIGLTQTVLPGSGYLHDARARTLEEAILWHGGEAEKAREAFRAAEPDTRQALLDFLGAL